MNEDDVLDDVCARLDGLGIPYALTGGLAVSYYGRPRATHDADIVVAIARVPGLPQKLIVKFEPDYYISEEAVIDALLHQTMFNIIHPHTGFKIDFWILKSDSFSQGAFRRRQTVSLGKQRLSILSLEDLILSKLQWYQLSQSDRHLNDIRGILAVQREALNKAYLNEWAKKLSVDEVLSAVWTESE